MSGRIPNVELPLPSGFVTLLMSMSDNSHGYWQPGKLTPSFVFVSASLYLKWLSCRQHTVGSCSFIQSDKFCHLTGLFWPLIFQVIFHMIALKSTIMLAVFYSLHLFFVSFCLLIIIISSPSPFSLSPSLFLSFLLYFFSPSFYNIHFKIIYAYLQIQYATSHVMWVLYNSIFPAPLFHPLIYFYQTFHLYICY